MKSPDSCPQSSSIVADGFVPLPDFDFQPNIFFQVLSGRLFGLDPPKSEDGGVVGGVMGSPAGLGALAESSVNGSGSALPLKKWLGALLLLSSMFREGVRRLVESEDE